MEAEGTMRTAGQGELWSLVSQWRLQRMTEVKRRAREGDGKDTRRIKGHTDLPRPFKLDDLVSVLIDVDLFLRMVAPVLDDDEQ